MMRSTLVLLALLVVPRVAMADMFPPAPRCYPRAEGCAACVNNRSRGDKGREEHDQCVAAANARGLVARCYDHMGAGAITHLCPPGVHVASGYGSCLSCSVGRTPGWSGVVAAVGAILALAGRRRRAA